MCVSANVNVHVNMQVCAPPYPQTKIKKEEDIEGHIDL